MDEQSAVGLGRGLRSSSFRSFLLIAGRSTASVWALFLVAKSTQNFCRNLQGKEISHV